MTARMRKASFEGGEVDGGDVAWRLAPAGALVETGDAEGSGWPFRVDAASGEDALGEDAFVYDSSWRDERAVDMALVVLMLRRVDGKDEDDEVASVHGDADCKDVLWDCCAQGPTRTRHQIEPSKTSKEKERLPMFPQLQHPSQFRVLFLSTSPSCVGLKINVLGMQN